MLKRHTQTGRALPTCHPIAMMPVSSGNLSTSSLSEILQELVDARQTGYLKIKEGEQEGFLAMENGTMINAGTGYCLALPALFQFVGWREARFDFEERPVPVELSRDLAVYDPQVLIDGVVFKEQELVILKKMPPKSAAA